MTLHDEMQDLANRWVACQVNRDVEGIVALYTADGSIYSPYGPPAIGRDAIRATFAQWVTGREINKRLNVIEAHGEGDVAFFLAAYSGDTPQDDGSLVNESGTVLNAALRQPGGAWKFHITSINRNLPSAAGDQAGAGT